MLNLCVKKHQICSIYTYLNMNGNILANEMVAGASLNFSTALMTNVTIAALIFLENRCEIIPRFRDWQLNVPVQ